MLCKQITSSGRLMSRSLITAGAWRAGSIRNFSFVNRSAVSRIPFQSGLINKSQFGGFINKRFLSTEMEKSISEAVKSAPVVLFMKGTPEAPACGFSRSTIALLGSIGVDPEKFAAYNVLEDPELRQGIKEYSDWPTIPQLYVNGEFVGGCDIVTSMAQSGELLELFEKDGLLVYEEEEGDVEEPSSSDIKPAAR